MMNLKTKISYTLYILLALVLFTSCRETFPNSEVFVVRKIQSHSNVFNYQLSPIKGKGLLFIKSTNFYNVGDTLTLKPN